MREQVGRRHASCDLNCWVTQGDHQRARAWVAQTSVVGCKLALWYLFAWR